ncbi:unnamed protein product [Phyllotreta striolata]|uniref:C-type lectin domain-containing protein n=1 Tax=Phyllotreta striolata TaxID=444603 RepID=A0A9N9XPK1_PHYSR|nr:unnamed protein product [Phyllotreta striolata]
MRSFLTIFCLFVCLSWTEANEVSQDFQVVKGANKTYFIHPQKTLFMEGLFICEESGLDLLSIDSEEENKEVTSEVASTGYKTFWTAGVNLNEKGNDWVWLTHKEQSPSAPITYFNWKQGQPTPVTPDSSCILFTKDDLEGTWSNVNCREEHIPICQSYISPI